MKNTIFGALILASSHIGFANAEPLKVIADIAPVHSLVAKVMDGVGTPTVILEPGASPHHSNLRPSKASAIQTADAVFYIGDELTPWLIKPLSKLNNGAVKVSLLNDALSARLASRDIAMFEEEHHEHEDDHGDDHHDDHEDGHHHGPIDPHAWLSPFNAQQWVTVIGDTLIKLDPENASTYSKNVADAVADLENMKTEFASKISIVSSMKFLAYHDAFQYLEKEFDLSVVGAISESDASRPSAKRLIELQKSVASLGVDCILTEPQFSENLVLNVSGGKRLNYATIDPLGSNLTLGPNMYNEMFHEFGEEIANCAAE
ncbi:zinc transporter [Amylibacter ulvae]|uniref:High-affinity zinc uptake system protein ZnuA n=1 Tax=Paramylibacter ulvae TaxID=1651968 RepID=A0ABQ3D4U1_9RHOB|nr:zinc ABC transporter substrate-binding protein [Amylibacter ulvae]GHA55995.1 zinc transporter [Amylibacter ulvae]